MVTVQTRTGNVGYRHQLDRARRFLERFEGPHANATDLQDIAWSFFQHCWHVKDWVKNDPLMTDPQKTAVKDAADASPLLMKCRAMCNGTKHLIAFPEAQHSHVDMKITVPTSGQTSFGTSEMDLLIDDGTGKHISGKQLARDCIAAWERILSEHGLAIARLS